MKLLQRVLVAIALAIWMALPGFGDDGGDNAGGTGIWILPRASYLAGDSLDGAVRAQRLPSPGMDMLVAVASNCGSCSATFVDELAGQPVSLQMFGGLVRVPASVLQSLPSGPGLKAHLVICDATQLGYVVRVERREDGSLVLKLL